LRLHSLKVAQLLRSAACLHTNQSRSYLNHLVHVVSGNVSNKISNFHTPKKVPTRKGKSVGSDVS